MDKKRSDLIVEAFRSWRNKNSLLEDATPFMIYRADTGTVLKRGVYGYDAARDAANKIRKQMGLKWDDVKFKKDKAIQKQQQARRMDYAPTINPSKGRRFRGYYAADGSYHDID